MTEVLNVGIIQHLGIVVIHEAVAERVCVRKYRQQDHDANGGGISPLGDGVWNFRSGG
jgi:hypothetical protein